MENMPSRTQAGPEPTRQVTCPGVQAEPRLGKGDSWGMPSSAAKAALRVNRNPSGHSSLSPTSWKEPPLPAPPPTWVCPLIIPSRTPSTHLLREVPTKHPPLERGNYLLSLLQVLTKSHRHQWETTDAIRSRNSRKRRKKLRQFYYLTAGSVMKVQSSLVVVPLTHCGFTVSWVLKTRGMTVYLLHW